MTYKTEIEYTTPNMAENVVSITTSPYTNSSEILSIDSALSSIKEQKWDLLEIRTYEI